MDALEAIMTRQSIRSYTGEGISRQMLRQIVSAGMQAPSAHACASWRCCPGPPCWNRRSRPEHNM